MSQTVKLQFLTPSGAVVSVEASIGLSVMQAAIFNNVEGIDAECGGSCMCATCHVYLAESRGTALAEPSEDEEAMLEEVAAGRRAESRLSCQLTVNAEMEGLTFIVPETQS